MQLVGILDVVEFVALVLDVVALDVVVLLLVDDDMADDP